MGVPAPPPRDYTGDQDGDDITEFGPTLSLLANCLPWGIIFLILLAICLATLLRHRTFIKFQVVLSARGGDIGTALHDTAASARDWTEALKGTIKKLIGEQHNFIYGSISVEVRRGMMVYCRHMGDLASKEMEKLEIQRVRLQNGELVPMLGPKQEEDYTFVTILVAVQGVLRLPSVDGNSEKMKDAINYLDIILDKIQKAEVLWSYKDPCAAHGLLESFPDFKSFGAELET